MGIARIRKELQRLDAAEKRYGGLTQAQQYRKIELTEKLKRKADLPDAGLDTKS